jgi:hypothetical protein
MGIMANGRCNSALILEAVWWERRRNCWITNPDCEADQQPEVINALEDYRGHLKSCDTCRQWIRELRD